MDFDEAQFAEMSEAPQPTAPASLSGIAEEVRREISCDYMVAIDFSEANRRDSAIAAQRGIEELSDAHAELVEQAAEEEMMASYRKKARAKQRLTEAQLDAIEAEGRERSDWVPAINERLRARETAR